MTLEHGKYYKGVGFVSPRNNSLKMYYSVKEIDEMRPPKIGFYKLDDIVFKVQYAIEYEGERFSVNYNGKKYKLKFQESSYHNSIVVST